MKKTILLLAAIIVLASCSKDDEGGSISLTFSGINHSMQKSASDYNVVDVSITDFRLSIRDVEFKKDKSELDSNEVEFRGPYDVDLMSETDALSQTLGTVDVPAGTYKVIRFKLHKSRERADSDPLYDRSLFLKGTIDGIPFEFWHDTSENFDIETTEGIIVSDNLVEVVVEFNIDQFLSSLHNIDLSQAQDENEDGLIEINPNDDDGNGSIADALKENIKEAADLIKL